MVPPDSDRISPVPPYSGYHYGHLAYAYRTFTPYGAAFQSASTWLGFRYCGPTTPTPCKQCIGLGCFPFARHYLGNHCCFLFLLLLRCFSSESSPPDLHRNTPTTTLPGWVAPFGYPRINASLQLPAAFRSLARPSSPLYAQASTVRPFLLFFLHGLHNPQADTPPHKKHHELDFTSI